MKKNACFLGSHSAQKKKDIHKLHSENRQLLKKSQDPRVRANQFSEFVMSHRRNGLQTPSDWGIQAVVRSKMDRRGSWSSDISNSDLAHPSAPDRDQRLFIPSGCVRRDKSGV